MLYTPLLILYFRIPHADFACPPNFAQTIVFKFSWDYYIFPRAFEEAKRVYYGEFENSQYLEILINRNHLEFQG